MIEELKVQGFEEFEKMVDYLKGKEIFCFFSGNKDSNGISWCPDCVISEPIVRQELESLNNSAAVYIYCAVGSREDWKNKNNKFRTDKRLKLTGVPTLMKWGEPNQKLTEQKIEKKLVSMLLNDD